MKWKVHCSQAFRLISRIWELNSEVQYFLGIEVVKKSGSIFPRGSMYAFDLFKETSLWGAKPSPEGTKSSSLFRSGIAPK